MPRKGGWAEAHGKCVLLLFPQQGQGKEAECKHRRHALPRRTHYAQHQHARLPGMAQHLAALFYPTTANQRGSTHLRCAVQCGEEGGVGHNVWLHPAQLHFAEDLQRGLRVTALRGEWDMQKHGFGLRWTRTLRRKKRGKHEAFILGVGPWDGPLTSRFSERGGCVHNKCRVNICLM